MHPRPIARLFGTALVLLVPFAGLAHASGAPARLRAIPVPAYVHNVGPLRPLASSSSVSASLMLAPRVSAALNAEALATNTPGNPAYHRWWKPGPLLQAFGPTPASVAQLLASLRSRGFRVTDAGWVVNATAPATTWEHTLSLDLATVVRAGHTYRIQATAGQEPGWMSSEVTGVDGLTTLPPPSLPQGKAPHKVVAPKKTALHPTSVPKGYSTTAQNGAFQVTAILPGGVNKPTGQPVHVVLTATVNGSPATDAGVTSYSTSSPSISDGSSYSEYGVATLPLYSSSPLSAQVSVTMYSDVSNGQPVPGAVSATVTLPTITWSGPSTLQALDAAQINAVYHASALVAEGQGASPPTIGLYESEPPSRHMLAALNTFASKNGLTPPTVFPAVNVNFGTPGPDSGREENMDLQAVEATSPGANLLVYSDPQFDMAATLNTVAQQKAVSVFSMSIAFSGQPGFSSLTDALAAEGITVIASSGDWGTIAGCGPNPNTTPTLSPPGICEPADFENVTSVGGTDVSVNQNSQAYYTQAWGGTYLSYLPSAFEAYVLSQYAASGGGYSQTQPIPSWQQGFVPNSATGKGVPDVALMADNNVAGLGMYSRQLNYEPGGGTSLGAPLLAGWAADLVAQMGHSLGNIAPSFYALVSADSSAFTQAVRGDNGAYQITSQDNSPGTWNPITGLGSPNIDLWASFVENGDQLPAPSVSVPTSASYGSPVTVSASWPGTSGATFQYWWEDPRDGVWHNSGAYSAGTYTFSPPVPGTFPVLAVAQAPGQPTTRTTTEDVAVATSRAMVSNLFVNYAGASTEPAGSTVTFTASATDAGNAPLYQFWVHGPNNTWTVAQNYSPTNHFTLSNLAPGSYTVAVYALDQQQVADGAWNQVYGYSTVVNVASSVTLSVPTTGTIGTAIPITATAYNLTNPVYQVWLQSPNGTWSQSGAYTHANAYTFTPQTAGLYKVVVYAKDPYAPNTSAFAVVAESTVQVSS